MDPDRSARGGRGDPCTQRPFHSVQAQNVPNGILLSDCGEEKEIASRRSFGFAQDDRGEDAVCRFLCGQLGQGVTPLRSPRR